MIHRRVRSAPNERRIFCGSGNALRDESGVVMARPEPADCGAPSRLLSACALAVLAPWPTAGPTLAFLQLLLGPANAAFSGHVLLGILDPADELVAGQRSDVLPGIECRGVGDQRLAQVSWKLVHHPTGHSRAAHRATVAARASPITSEAWVGLVFRRPGDLGHPGAPTVNPRRIFLGGPRCRRTRRAATSKGLVRPHRTKGRKVPTPCHSRCSAHGRLRRGPGRCAESPVRTRTHGKRETGVWPSMRW